MTLWHFDSHEEHAPNSIVFWYPSEDFHSGVMQSPGYTSAAEAQLHDVAMYLATSKVLKLPAGWPADWPIILMGGRL